MSPADDDRSWERPEDGRDAGQEAAEREAAAWEDIVRRLREDDPYEPGHAQRPGGPGSGRATAAQPEDTAGDDDPRDGDSRGRGLRDGDVEARDPGDRDPMDEGLRARDPEDRDPGDGDFEDGDFEDGDLLDEGLRDSRPSRGDAEGDDSRDDAPEEDDPEEDWQPADPGDVIAGMRPGTLIAWVLLAGVGAVMIVLGFVLRGLPGWLWVPGLAIVLGCLISLFQSLPEQRNDGDDGARL